MLIAADEDCLVQSKSTANKYIYILVWDASPWVLDVSTLTDEKFCSSECKGRNFAGDLASIFFYHEKHSLVDNGIFRGTFFQFTYTIQIFSLTGDIPPSPGDIPRS